MHPPWTISPQGLCHAAKTSLDFLLCSCHNSYGSQRALSLFWGYCWNNSFCPSSRENSFVTVRITHYTQPEVRVSHNKVLNFLVFAVSCQDGNQISTDLHQHYLSYTTVPTHTQADSFAATKLTIIQKCETIVLWLTKMLIYQSQACLFVDSLFPGGIISIRIICTVSQCEQFRKIMW